MDQFDPLFWGWLSFMSVFAFLLFGYDKFRARQEGGRRISEFHLVLIGALGGWFGGLLGMLIFRHKTSKGWFMLKYAGGLLIFGWLIYGWTSGSSARF